MFKINLQCYYSILDLQQVQILLQQSYYREHMHVLITKDSLPTTSL